MSEFYIYLSSIEFVFNKEFFLGYMIDFLLLFFMYIVSLFFILIFFKGFYC